MDTPPPYALGVLSSKVPILQNYVANLLNISIKQNWSTQAKVGFAALVEFQFENATLCSQGHRIEE